MTLNDFKAIEGDRAMGIRSLPAQLGADRAAKLACWVMAVPQVVVIGLMLYWGQEWAAITVSVLLLAQLACMLKMLKDPMGLAPWYNATGVSLYVSGMMVCAFAVRGLV
jgi:chlorophyll synthase